MRSNQSLKSIVVSLVALLATAHAPVYVLPGNKDDRTKLRSAFSAEGYFTAGYDFMTI